MNVSKQIKHLETEHLIQRKLGAGNLSKPERSMLNAKIKLLEDELVRLHANIFISDKMIA